MRKERTLVARSGFIHSGTPISGISKIKRAAIHRYTDSSPLFNSRGKGASLLLLKA
ncbi:hypothetical protein PAESOLCIP111_00910 [Paenibacillus solanacearum]|uniref:Uncharacterized protein n=1 Tax=Paenibacillus solanacearum TaxID=2048548 RepID=A0A916JWU3_9BACL|nr:hypothetical protein PAESOLCIP111_00910 [Paenibacillus solanacearum]